MFLCPKSAVVLEVALSPVFTSASGWCVQVFQQQSCFQSWYSQKRRLDMWVMLMCRSYLGQAPADPGTLCPAWGASLVFSRKMQHQPGGETTAASTSPPPSMDTTDAVFLPVTGSAILVAFAVTTGCTKCWLCSDMGPLYCTYVPCICSSPSSAKQEVNPDDNKGLC